MRRSINVEALSLDQLRTFVAVVETGSFSAAARRVGRVQSAVSTSVATLEEHLGLLLFDRAGYRPALTPAGARVLDAARPVLDALGALADVASTLGAGVEDPVSIAVDALFPLDALVRFARGFDARWPGVPLRFQTETLSAVPGLVADGTCALGITNDELALPAFAARPLVTVRMVAVVGPGHPLAHLDRPVTAADVALYHQVVLSGRGPEAEAPDRGVLSPSTWRVLDLDAKQALIRAGLGWGRLPEDRAADDLGHGRLRRIEIETATPFTADIRMVAIWLPSRPLGPASGWALDELVRACAAVPRTA